MSQRLRYEKTGDPHVIRSKNVHTADGRYIYITLHKVAMSFNIFDVNTNEQIGTGGNTKSYVVLLRQAKKALEDLGVVFGKEARKDYVKSDDKAE